MQRKGRDDWSQGDEAEHLARMQAAPARRRLAMARGYDWGQHPEYVLGWAMAQKGVGLGTALSVFFNGGPERFNYLHKREVPVEWLEAARLMDNICLRVNSGFYLSQVEDAPADPSRIRKWLAIQHIDRAKGCCGRWVLDETIVEPALSDSEPSETRRAPLASARRQFSLAGFLQLVQRSAGPAAQGD